MERTTTLIVTVGFRFDIVSKRIADTAGNVAVERAPSPVESLPDWVDQLRAVWRRAQQRAAIYTILSEDPLGPVVREWARRLEGEPSDLELAIGLVGDAPMPDFYLVDPVVSGSLSHWYLDHLARLAPRRVILTEPTEPDVLTAVRRLPYGKELPGTRDVLESARHYVPVPELDPLAQTTLFA